MTFTRAHYASMAAHAADSKRDSARDGGLAIILTARQDGRCFDCGEAKSLEFCHFTRADGRTSRTMGVIGAMGCRECNLVHDIVCDTLGTDGTIPVEYLMANGRADRIITEYPTRAECVRVYRATRDHDAIVADARARMADAGL